MQKRMGRPPKRPEERKAEKVYTRLTPAQRQMVERAAAAAGMPLSDFLRACVLTNSAGVANRRKRRNTQPPSEGESE